jgi:hypothetical protein
LGNVDEEPMLRTLWARARDWMAASQKSRLRRALLMGLFVLPALAFIAYQTWRNWEELRAYSWDLRPGLWAVGFGAYSVALLCELVAWNVLMGRLGGVHRFLTNARLYCVSNLSKRLPGVVWYLTGRALLYREEGVPAAVALTGSALELAMLAATGPLAYFLALPWAAGRLAAGPAAQGAAGLPQAWMLPAAVAALVLGGVILQPPVFNRVASFFLRRLGSTAQVAVGYRDILPLVPLYLVAWAMGGVLLYVVARSLYPLPLGALPATLGLWALSGTLTLLISIFLFGTGVREVTLSVLLTPLMPQPLPVVVALALGLLVTLSELAWTGALALLPRRGPPAPAEDP